MVLFGGFFFSACLFRNIASYRLMLWFCGPWMLLFEKNVLQALWLFFQSNRGNYQTLLAGVMGRGETPSSGLTRLQSANCLPGMGDQGTPCSCLEGHSHSRGSFSRLPCTAPHSALQRMSPTGGARLARSSQLSSWPWSVPWKELHQEANVKVCEPEACQTDPRATHPKNSPAKFACTWNTRLCPPTPWDIGAPCAIRRNKGHFI